MKLGFEHFYVQINLFISHVRGQNFKCAVLVINQTLKYSIYLLLLQLALTCSEEFLELPHSVFE